MDPMRITSFYSLRCSICAASTSPFRIVVDDIFDPFTLFFFFPSFLFSRSRSISEEIRWQGTRTDDVRDFHWAKEYGILWQMGICWKLVKDSSCICKFPWERKNSAGTSSPSLMNDNCYVRLCKCYSSPRELWLFFWPVPPSPLGFWIGNFAHSCRQSRFIPFVSARLKPTRNVGRFDGYNSNESLGEPTRHTHTFQALIRYSFANFKRQF